MTQQLHLKFIDIQYIWEEDKQSVSCQSIQSFVKRIAEKITATENQITDSRAEADLLCAVLKTKDLNGDTFTDFLNRYWTYYFDASSSHKPIPILFISMMDIMSYADDRGDETDEYIPAVFERLHLNRRFRFLDSNIWMQYIPILPIQATQPSLSFIDRLKRKIEYIRQFYDQGLYRLIVTHEYLEFQLRLLINSNIKEIQNTPGGHKQVVPFRFHSESKLAQWANSIQRQISHLSWQILIIDDYSRKKLAEVAELSTSNGSSTINKADIIRKLACQYSLQGQSTMTPLPQNIGFEEMEDLEESIEAILQYPLDQQDLPKDPWPDIILLDYLFEDQNEKFGYHLLEEVKKLLKAHANAKTVQPTRKLGPLKKLHIMPISVYANVFSDKMIDLGLPHNYWFWNLYASADPISTPELFRFNLFRVMKQQLEGLVRFTYEKKGEEEIGSPQLLHYSRKIILGSHTANMDIEQLRNNALEQYANIIELGARFKTLVKYQDSSCFANSVIKHYFFGFSLEHWGHFEAVINFLRFFTRHRVGDIMHRTKLLIRFLGQQITSLENLPGSAKIIEDLEEFRTIIQVIEDIVIDQKFK